VGLGLEVCLTAVCFDQFGHQVLARAKVRGSTTVLEKEVGTVLWLAHPL